MQSPGVVPSFSCAVARGRRWRRICFARCPSSCGQTWAQQTAFVPETDRRRWFLTRNRELLFCAANLAFPPVLPKLIQGTLGFVLVTGFLLKYRRSLICRGLSGTNLMSTSKFSTTFAQMSKHWSSRSGRPRPWSINVFLYRHARIPQEKFSRIAMY